MPEKPNILLIMTDQQRYESLGCTGFEAAHTPNLDRLASEGTLFERCYVNNPICTPSRSSMFTGKHVQGHGVNRLYEDLPDDEVLFTQHLREVGYETALFGKLHVCGRVTEEAQRHPNDGFDIYEWCLESSLNLDSPFNGYAAWLKHTAPDFLERLKSEGRGVLHHPREVHFTHWAAERTIDFIENRDNSRPFFAMMSVFDPHDPYEDWPEEMADLIDGDNIPDPLIIDGEMDGLPAGVRQEHERCAAGPFGNFTLEQLRRIRFGYHASIAFADLEMGRVLDTLREQGIENNTLVIFVSDHGDMLGDHSLLIKGAFPFEQNVHVPLIMRWPERFDGGNRVDSLVQVHDLAATVLSAAGLDDASVRERAPEAEDLAPLAASERGYVRDWAAMTYRNTGLKHGGGYQDPQIHSTMFLDERYKLSIYHDVSDQPYGTPGPASNEPSGMLFDLENDPQEQVNLWSDPAYREVRLRLMERMLDWEVSQELRYGRRGADIEPQASQRVIKDPTRDR